MQRLLLSGLTFGLLSGAIVIATVDRLGDAAWEHGRAMFAARAELRAATDYPPRADTEVLAFVGDSTLTRDADVVAYPYATPKHLLGVAPWVIATAGMDPYGYYFVLEPILARRPIAVVLVANLRLLGADAPRDFSLLADSLPLSELPRAAILPLHGRGLTFVGLLLRRAMAMELVRSGAGVFDGVRRLYADGSVWQRAHPVGEPTAVEQLAYLSALSREVASYDAPLGRDSPVVRMLGEAVRRIRRAQIPAVVIVTPMPIGLLRGRGLYDDERTRTRIAAVRVAVAEAGGDVVDAHDWLPDADFRDASGHPTQAGHDRIARDLLSRVGILVATASQR